MTFSVGDVVTYCGDIDWDGSTGTIVATYLPDYMDEVHSVCWSDGKLLEYQSDKYPSRGFVTVYGKCLKSMQYQYNPDQTGDTEEDI